MLGKIGEVLEGVVFGLTTPTQSFRPDLGPSFLLQAMPAAGMEPDGRTAYILIRAAVNTGQLERAAALEERFTSAGVRMKPTALRLLEGSGSESDGGSSSQ